MNNDVVPRVDRMRERSSVRACVECAALELVNTITNYLYYDHRQYRFSDVSLVKSLSSAPGVRGTGGRRSDGCAAPLRRASSRPISGHFPNSHKGNCSSHTQYNQFNVIHFVIGTIFVLLSSAIRPCSITHSISPPSLDSRPPC